MKNKRITKLKKKIILLLATGVALSASKTLTKQILILNQTSKEWRLINRNSLRQSVTSLYESNLISLRPKGGSFEMVLSNQGKKFAARFNLENLKIKKQKKWDGFWRIVLFDIPETRKKIREAIRFHLKEMGFVEYQKSVFILPYPCEKEIKFVAEFYHARRYIRLIVANMIDNEDEFKRKFNI